MNNFVVSGFIGRRLVADFIQYTEQDLREGAPLQLIVNSQGGHAYCARALAGLIRLMRSSGVVIDTLGIGDIHSAAVLIFAAGEKRRLSKYATVMMHQDSGNVEGSTQDVVDYGLQMEADERQWCQALEDFTGTSADKWSELQEDGDKYLTPDECLKLNLATEIV